MSKNNQNKKILDGVNRCDRCNRPLSNPAANYGWRCAQIIGLNNYYKIADSLDSDELLIYNEYISNYLADDNVAIDNSAQKSNTIKDTSLPKTSFLPTTDWQKASDIIERNATAIKNAGLYYGVNPAIIAACIYTEQTTNVNIIDHLTDVALYFADTSIGIGQVRVSTARMLEDNGYIAKTEYKTMEVYGNNISIIWNTPGYSNGTAHANNRNEAIAKRLTVESENINYVAAYLRYFQDRWKNAYPKIDGDTAILATLFNQDEIRSPHPKPVPNPFGNQAKKEYDYMRQLLGLY